MMDELRQDISFALRQLRKAPAFTLALTGGTTGLIDGVMMDAASCSR